jgi:hypothetical protein
MEPSRVKSVTEKVAKAMIVIFVVMGAIAFAAFRHVSDGGEFMSKVFLIFFGAIIAMQAIPGLLLLGGMLKGLSAKKVAMESDADKSAPK